MRDSDETGRWKYEGDDETARRRLGSGAYERVDMIGMLIALAKARTGADADALARRIEQLNDADAARYRDLVQVMRERAHAYERQCLLAGCDELTSLPNRRTFNEVLSREVARCHRSRRPLSLLLLDLDGLKEINDSDGHLAGDEAIQAVARAAIASLRSSDVVARIGGDEFAVVLPETTVSQAAVITARIRRKLAMDPGARPGLGVSIGSAVMSDDTLQANGLIDAADRALYADKRTRHP